MNERMFPVDEDIENEFLPIPRPGDEYEFAEYKARNAKRMNRIRSRSEEQLEKTDDEVALTLMHCPTKAYNEACALFVEAVNYINGSTEGRLIAIHGKSQSGKSHILNRFTQHKDLQPEFTGTEGVYRPLLMTRASAPGSHKSLGWDILLKLKNERPQLPAEREINEAYRRATATDIWNQVRAQLEAQNTSILIIDEIHSILVGDGRKQLEQTAATLKSLIVDYDWPMTLVIAGTTDKTKELLTEYEELGERVRSLEIMPVAREVAQTEIEDFLECLEEMLQFSEASNLRANQGWLRFYHATDGHRGRISRLVQNAARLAYEKGDNCIELHHLAEVYEETSRRKNEPNYFADLNHVPDKPPRPVDPNELEEDEGIADVAPTGHNKPQRRPKQKKARR